MSGMSFTSRLLPRFTDEVRRCRVAARLNRQASAGSVAHPLKSILLSGQKPLLDIGRKIAAGLVVLVGSSLVLAPEVSAQGAGIINSGDLVITGFSGTRPSAAGTIDTTFIDLDGASLKVFDIGDPGAPRGQLINVAPKFKAFARDIGQVFGVALDDAFSPNIYATATSVHGLQIVGSDTDGDGLPDRIKIGQPDAQFMDGQFGVALGGGPGSVWKIDGVTGFISLFANIEGAGRPNSGPGLGNIAYDPAHYQLYVSDLDTGLIHRLGMAGNQLGSFDHGAQGLPAAGFGAVPMDPANVMDITSPVFDAENSNTWGLADPRRRVWGLAYHGGRLYYGVEEGPQIWSVGIAVDGSFAGDARLEIDLVPGAYPVSDILFTPRGRMIVAQRGGIYGSYDYTRYHEPKTNRVLRYRRDHQSGLWVQEPQEYAIGFPVDHQNASGGVGLSCGNRLWSTGDALRDDPALAGQLAFDGPAVVHGVQGNALSLVRPRNVPPWSSVFVDYDGLFADPEKAGHVGDVEVYRDCKGGRAETWPGWTPGWTPPPEWIPPPWWPETPDLEIEKTDSLCVDDPQVANSYLCTFTITVTNVGAGVFVGQLNVTDNLSPNAEYVPPPGGSIPWACVPPAFPGDVIACVSQNVETLLPGQSETLELTIRRPAEPSALSNCAIVDQPGDPHGNNEDCGEGYPPGPDLEMQKTLNQCITVAGGTECTFWLDVINSGNAIFNGPLHVVETLPAGSSFLGIVSEWPAGWNCWAINPGEVNCSNPGPVTLWPNDLAFVEIRIFIPFGAGGNLQNCVRLGDPEHAGDPDINGNNSVCVPFAVQPPMPMPMPQTCPAGYKDLPPTGAPPGWVEEHFQIQNPDGSILTIKCMKEGPIGLLKGPGINFCPQGWKKYPSSTSVPKGWKKMTVGSGKKAIICARYMPPPPALNCPSGWTKYPSATSVPQGWKQTRVGKGRDAIVCARFVPPPPPPPPKCPAGWTKYSNAASVPRGWKQTRIGTGRNAIVCARFVPPPPPVNCPAGWAKHPAGKAVPRGWKQMRIGRPAIVCVKPQQKPKPREVCWSGWKEVPRGWRQTGWTVRQKSSRPPLYCAKQQKVTQPRVCPQGWRSFPRGTRAPSGWKLKRLGKGASAIVCAKPPTGGTFVPPAGEITQPRRCRNGTWDPIEQVCVRKPAPSTRQPQVTPVRCGRGFVRRGNRCIKVVRPTSPKKPKPILCRKGQRLVGRRCVTVRPPPSTRPPAIQRPQPGVTPLPTLRPAPKRPQKRPPSEIEPPAQKRPNILIIPQTPQLQMIPGRILCPSGQVSSGGKCVNRVQ
ncbi:hypothetical protein MNBD_ALPHA09-957 [hydrothermal vent metagenome]|uniref:Uncharacterized protein n=1 Tax=hydrothermal vent metagenome TaxID=652676 RepID=A0A3B0TEB7_9ZZZZ